MKFNTKQLAMIGMLCALAYIVVALIRIPVVSFLKYEPKDVIVVMGGFMFGPLASFAISAIVSLVEMVTISDTGIIGCVMNLISTCAFACTAAFIYKKKRTLPGAVIGLGVGVAVMTVIMLLWNYLITPLYMGVPRNVVAGMLTTVFLPFNLAKGGINASLTMVLYKPVVTALRKAGLVQQGSSAKRTTSRGLLIVSLILLVSFVLWGLVLADII